MSCTVGGEAQLRAPQRNANQQAIADLAASEEPLTWLFMGDSITHGARFTFGRDSISQMFEKFLKDDLGRVDDIVINTAVSSADTNDTIAELHARLNRYEPDDVSIMIGTNDSATHINMGEVKYKENLRTIIAAIQEKGAKVILRTPIPTKDSTRPEIGNYADWMGEVAAEYDDVILVEQYDAMGALFTAAPCMIPILFNSGGCYALRPSLSGTKHQHLCKVAGAVTELTITGITPGTGTITAGNHVLNVTVLAPSGIRITLDYNYPGAPENGRLTVGAGDPIGQLPVPMRPGCTFFGWNLNGSKITSSYVVTEPITLTADWVTVPTKEKPSGGTTNGHIYAFYVNKDGSMELAVDYDITPYASEYYAYSCLTVLTQGEEAGDLALFWEDSWTSSPASCTI